MQENIPDMQCLKALIQGVISHTTTCIPCASDCQSGSFLLALTLLVVPLSVFLHLRQWTLWSIPPNVFCFIWLNQHIFSLKSFSLSFSFPPPLSQRSQSALRLSFWPSENKQDRKGDWALSKSSAVQYWRAREREKWGKTLLNRQPSRYSSPNRLQCIFNSSHSMWICINLGKRCWIAQVELTWIFRIA